MKILNINPVYSARKINKKRIDKIISYYIGRMVGKVEIISIKWNRYCSFLDIKFKGNYKNETPLIEMYYFELEMQNRLKIYFNIDILIYGEKIS